MTKYNPKIEALPLAPLLLKSCFSDLQFLTQSSSASSFNLVHIEPRPYIQDPIEASKWWTRLIHLSCVLWAISDWPTNGPTDWPMDRPTEWLIELHALDWKHPWMDPLLRATSTVVRFTSQQPQILSKTQSATFLNLNYIRGSKIHPWGPHQSLKMTNKFVQTTMRLFNAILFSIFFSLYGWYLFSLNCTIDFQSISLDFAIDFAIDFATFTMWLQTYR